MGGMAATVPVRSDHVARQMLPMAAGGPLASLALVVVAGALSTLLPGRAGGYAAVATLLSAAIFLVTAVPFRAGGFMSDGMQVIELLRGGKAVLERSDLIRLMSSSLAGARPRDWDPALMSRIEAMNSSEPLRLLACWLVLLQHAMDCADPARAREFAGRLAENLDQYPDGFRQSLRIELCIEAVQRQDLPTAEQHLALTKGGVTELSRLELARALVAGLRGDGAAARRHRDAGRAALRHAMDPGVSVLTADQLAAIPD